MKDSILEKLNKFGHSASDTVAGFVGTWKFVLLYTTSMFLWIILHVNGVLSLDSKDFIRWNLWLSYFAGIQASILLMASNRELEKDRERAMDVLKLTEHNLSRVNQISKDVDGLEVLITDILEDIKEMTDDTDGSDSASEQSGPETPDTSSKSA